MVPSCSSLDIAEVRKKRSGNLTLGYRMQSTLGSKLTVMAFFEEKHKEREESGGVSLSGRHCAP